MKMIITNLLFIYIGLCAQAEMPDSIMAVELMTEAQSDVLDPATLTPLGRAVKNRETKEFVQFVCLHPIQGDQGCTRFQLRENGTTLVGAVMVMRSIPKGELQRKITDTVDAHYDSKKWKYRMSLLEAAFNATDAEAGGFVLIGGGYFIVGMGLSKVFLAGVSGVWLMPGAFLVGEMILHKLPTLIQRAVIAPQQSRAHRRTRKALNHFSNSRKSHKRPIPLSGQHYQFFISSIKEMLNP